MAIGTGDEIRSDGRTRTRAHDGAHAHNAMQRQQGGSEPEVSDGLTE